MDYAENAKERLKNHWRTKVEAAEIRYSEAPSVETRAAYLSVLKTFADLVLRGEAPEVPDGAEVANGLPSLC